MSRGIWLVEWVSGQELLTRFFRTEHDARKFCEDLYNECLIVGDVSRDDYRVYSDLADANLL